MFIEPMLLGKSEKPFNDDKYIVEWKQDGWRMLLSKFNGQIRLYSRHKNEFTYTFREFLDLEIPDNSIYDCELISVDSNGKCDFEALQQEYKSKNRTNPLQLVVFDVIFYKGQDIRRKPLMERKKILEESIIENEKIVISRYVDGEYSTQYFDLIKQQDLEGIVMKLKDSTYESKRSNSWLKVLNTKREKVFISGIRKGEFGVYLSFLNGEYAGMIEFMKPDDRKKIYNLIKDLKDYEDDSKIILKKKEIVEVEFRNKYKSGLLRIPKLVS